MISRIEGAWLLIVALFIASCGGGGGGGSASGSFTMSGSVTFEADVDGPRPLAKSLRGEISGASGPLYIYVELSGSGVIENATAELDDGGGELILTPGLPHEIGNGVHSDTVTVSVCSDFNCNSHLKGSPKAIDVTYRVTPLTGMTVRADVTAGGGFTETSGLIQCPGSCEKLIYGEVGDTVRLWPQEQPGYVFTGWSGACSGTSSCAFSFQVNSVVEVTANFAPTGVTFDLCPGDPSASFSGNASVPLPKVNDLIPLCNGYVILAMDDGQVIVRDAINELDDRVYQLSSIAYELALDEENRFLYATHSDEQKISRINLATGAVSELYYRGGDSFEPFQSEYGHTPDIAVTDEGTLLAPDYFESFLSRRAYLYDSATGMYQKTVEVFGGNYRYIDSPKGLLTSEPGSWRFYSFYVNDQNFTLRNWASMFCGDTIMSPDGIHVVWSCGDGQGPGYKIFDWDGINSSIFSNNIKLGEWDVGFMYADSSFSPSSESILFIAEEKLKLFDVNTYGLLWESDIEVMPGCTFFSPVMAAISTDEKLAYSLNDCGDGSSGSLTWASIASPE